MFSLQRLLGKDDRIFELLEESARQAQISAHALLKFLQNPCETNTLEDFVLCSRAENRIRAVCVGDYLAMYVNGTFVGDATDDTYSVGQVGLVGAAASRLGLQVDFDNLTVSAATEG